MRNLQEKFLIFISFYFFCGSSFLLLNEQFRRLRIPWENAFFISGIVLFVLMGMVFFYFRKNTFYVSETLLKKSKKNLFEKNIFYFFFLFYLILLGFSIFSFQVQFEKSVDSEMYHLQIIKSLLSFFQDFNLNSELPIYTETFPRMAESFSALWLIMFQKLTFLQGQFFCFLFLISFAFFRFYKILEARTTFVFFVFLLSVPTIFLQLQTNYIDLFVVPLFLIGVSFLMRAKSEFDFFLGLLWLALLGGVKLPFFIISFFTIFCFFIYKKQKKEITFKWKGLFLGGICFCLPLLPLLVVNFMEYSSPVAPYSLLFFNGEDVFNVNFLPNRPPEFREIDIFAEWGGLRFLYSHFYKSFEFFVHYDARLGGGGFLFPLLLLGVGVIYLQKIFCGWKTKSLSFKATVRKFKISDWLLVVAIFSMVIIPETYWFRYIILTFLCLALILFFKIETFSKKIKKTVLLLILGLSFSQFFISKIKIMEVYSQAPKSISDFLNFNFYSSKNINENLLRLKKQLKDSKSIALFMNLESHDRLIGSYLSALPVFSKVKYFNLDATSEFVIEDVLQKVDSVILIGKDRVFLEKKLNQNFDLFIYDGINVALVISPLKESLK